MQRITEIEKLAIRESNNPDHHLWNNNGTWWVHYTVHIPGNQADRVRQSLGTRNRRVARSRRDRIFQRLEKLSMIG